MRDFAGIFKADVLKPLLRAPSAEMATQNTTKGLSLSRESIVDLIKRRFNVLRDGKKLDNLVQVTRLFYTKSPRETYPILLQVPLAEERKVCCCCYMSTWQSVLNSNGFPIQLKHEHKMGTLKCTTLISEKKGNDPWTDIFFVCVHFTCYSQHSSTALGFT